MLVCCEEETIALRIQAAPDEEGVEMEFRLVYQGPLASGSSTSPRSKEKHAIRKQLHIQLKELWDQIPFLKNQRNPVSVIGGQAYTELDMIANDYARCGFRFVPLINNKRGLACSLDILFLRRDAPGNLIKSGGDIDNRIKVLFDALRMPQECSELAGAAPGADENPFFCLLENDDLITSVNVTTDRLLLPVEPPPAVDSVNNVVLVIKAKVRVVDPQKASLIGYYSD